ncbi:hypothetical protein CYMTET_30291, partial [Cymbomonas tetramitiformis]
RPGPCLTVDGLGADPATPDVDGHTSLVTSLPDLAAPREKAPAGDSVAVAHLTWIASAVSTMAEQLALPLAVESLGASSHTLPRVEASRLVSLTAPAQPPAAAPTPAPAGSRPHSEQFASTSSATRLPEGMDTIRDQLGELSRVVREMQGDVTGTALAFRDLNQRIHRQDETDRLETRRVLVAGQGVNGPWSTEQRNRAPNSGARPSMPSEPARYESSRTTLSSVGARTGDEGSHHHATRSDPEGLLARRQELYEELAILERCASQQ